MYYKLQLCTLTDNPDLFIFKYLTNSVAKIQLFTRYCIYHTLVAYSSAVARAVRS